MYIFSRQLQVTKHLDLTIILDLVATVFGCINLSVYCFFGKLATESFKKMSNRLYECDWIQFPIDVKKTILLTIMNTQQPIYYHGFGLAFLNLETFGKVKTVFFKIQTIIDTYIYKNIKPFILFQLIRKVYNYYTILKSFPE